MISETAKDDALSFLTARSRSEEEVRRHLAGKSHSSADIDMVIDWLYEYEFLDDTAFAGAYIRDKLRFHPCGSLKLKHELLAKGIDETTAERALAKNYPKQLERRLAWHFYKKQRERGRSDQQAKRYLYGKGFAGDTVVYIEEIAAEHLDI